MSKVPPVRNRPFPLWRRAKVAVAAVAVFALSVLMAEFAVGYLAEGVDCLRDGESVRGLRWVAAGVAGVAASLFLAGWCVAALALAVAGRRNRVVRAFEMVTRLPTFARLKRERKPGEVLVRPWVGFAIIAAAIAAMLILGGAFREAR